MAVKTPVKATFTGSDVTGLAEYQSADFIGVVDGGTGAVTFTAGILKADGTNAFTTVSAPTGDIVGVSDTQTLTNKTIDASNNTISNIGNSALSNSNFTIVDDSSTSSSISLGETLQFLGGTGVSSTVSGDSVTLAIDNTVTTLSGTQTLTNKTIDASNNTLSNIGNSSLTNSSITVTDGSTSTATALGGTITFSGTTNEVEVGESSGTITIGLPSDVTIGNDLTVSNDLTITGNLTVNGTTTTISTTNTVASDTLFELGNGTTGSPANDSGIVIERGDSDNAFIGFDESTDKFTVGTGTFTGASTGNLSITTGTLVANIEGNITGDVTGNADTATALATARTIAGQSFDGTANITIASTDLSDTASIVLLNSTQTLTNKTLTTPVISSISNTGTLTLPTSTDTIVGRATTDTLTNKTIDSASNTITVTESNISDLQSYILADSTDTLTNKTISGSSNTLTNIANSSLINSGITVVDDSSTSSSINLGETLKIAGGTGVSSSISGDTLTISVSGLSATSIGNGDVDNTELSYLNGVTSNIQTQLDAKATTAFAIAQAVALG